MNLESNSSLNGEEKSFRHVAMVAKFLGDNNRKRYLKFCNSWSRDQLSVSRKIFCFRKILLVGTERASTTLTGFLRTLLTRGTGKEYVKGMRKLKLEQN